MINVINERRDDVIDRYLAAESTYKYSLCGENAKLRKIKENNKPRNQVTGASMVSTTASANACMGFRASLSGILIDVLLV